MGYGDNPNPRDNTFFIDISADDDLSEPMFKGHLDICGLRFGSEFDGAAVTFLESETETGTYQEVWWEDAAFTLTVTASKTVMFDPTKLSGIKWLKITSDGPEAGTDSEVIPIFRDFS
jgi:hypothetical protein